VLYFPWPVIRPSLCSSLLAPQADSGMQVRVLRSIAPSILKMNAAPPSSRNHMEFLHSQCAKYEVSLWCHYVFPSLHTTLFLHCAEPLIILQRPTLRSRAGLGPENGRGIVLLLDVQQTRVNRSPEGVLPVGFVDVTLFYISSTHRQVQKFTNLVGVDSTCWRHLP